MKGFVREKCRSRGFRRSGIVRRIPPFSQLIRTFSRTIRAEPPHFDGMGIVPMPELGDSTRRQMRRSTFGLMHP